MSSTYKRLIDGGYVPAVTGAGYTATARTVIHKMTFTNKEATAATVTIYLVPSGSSASNAYAVANQHSIASEETWSCPDVEGHVLDTGDTIEYFCNTPTAVAVVCSGVEIT